MLLVLEIARKCAGTSQVEKDSIIYSAPHLYNVDDSFRKFVTVC